MNILYISKLDGRPWIGPTYSVPNQVKSQAKFDNVLWYNLVNTPIPEGKSNVEKWRQEKYYIDLTTVPSGRIKDLPHPFSNPDLIIVEQGYPFAREAIRREIMKLNVPYIVVPRGELTASAQSKKKIKKIIGNIVLGYYRFMGKAKAIHFLTEQEKRETSEKWNKNSIVIPNGTIVPSRIQRNYQKDQIKCVSIGRIEPYQKGIDLLIEACIEIKQQLIDNNVTITFYGSNQEGKLDELKKMITDNGMTAIISFHDGVFGQEKEDVLISADVFLMTSRFEGHPTGLLEALAYGLPCLVTTGSNMRKEVEAANAGWGADNSVEAIKNAMIAMILQRKSYINKGENAYNLSLKYDWDALAKKAHSIYKRLLNIE